MVDTTSSPFPTSCGHSSEAEHPTGGWRKKVNHFVKGGDFGYREDKINELLMR